MKLKLLVTAFALTIPALMGNGRSTPGAKQANDGEIEMTKHPRTRLNK